MRYRIAAASIAFSLSFTLTLDQGESQEKEISSRVIATEAGEKVVVQELVVDAPVEALWDAYVTAEGWTAWAAPVAEVDLRAGGTIRSHYTPNASIGDAGTNTLQIVNYVPRRVLTLQAELAENWPEIMKADADKLMNVVLFESMGDERSKIYSYGVGYGDSEAYEGLIEFFIPANEGLFRNLKAYLEEGKRAEFKED